jgi:hypothetical protein
MNLAPMEELAYRHLLDMIFKSHDHQRDDDRVMPLATKAGRQWKAVKAALVKKGKISLEGGFIRALLAAGERLHGGVDGGGRELDVSRTECARLRAAVFARDGLRGTYCGAVGATLECDHIEPLARSGSSAFNDLAAACIACNRSKGARPLSEWRVTP